MSVTAKHIAPSAKQHGKPSSQPSLSSKGRSFAKNKALIQAKLTVNAPGDRYEREADAMADRIMRMPYDKSPIQLTQGMLASSVQRKCTHCEEEELLTKPLMRKEEGGGFSVSSGLTSQLSASKGGGSPLPGRTRSFMENAFSTDFSQVRVHTDGQAAEMNSGIHARAFTHGNDIYFNKGQYQPESSEGKHLLAHELTHVVQQEGGDQAVIQRNGERPNLEEMAEDPNFLLCFALCELGLPPALWRTVTSMFLEATFEEYKVTRGEARASGAFQEFRLAYSTWSRLNKLKAIVGFIAEGRLGLLPIRGVLARRIRARLILQLARVGVTRGSIAAASQILRKVIAVIEIAYAAGCLTYCGGLAYARFLVDFTQGIADALVSIGRAIESIGEGIMGAIGSAIGRSLFYARAFMNPSNWNLTNIPQRSRGHLNVVGLLGSGLAPNLGIEEFISFVNRPFSSSLDQSFFNELAEDLNTALHQRGGFFQAIQFTPELIRRQSPFSLIQLLNDYGLIRFIRDPNQLADIAMRESEEQ